MLNCTQRGATWHWVLGGGGSVAGNIHVILIVWRRGLHGRSFVVHPRITTLDAIPWCVLLTYTQVQFTYLIYSPTNQCVVVAIYKHGVSYDVANLCRTT